MYRLCYISSARSTLDAADIEQILRTSRVNNRRSGVTGLLMVGNRRFLQLLEGDEAAVRATYDRILGDTRHYAPVIVDRRDVDDRQFGEWDMGLVRPEDDQAQRLLAILATIRDANLRAQFQGFFEIHGERRSAA